MIKKIFLYIGLILAIAALVIGFIWTNLQATADRCRYVIVDIENADSTSFVTQGGIINLLNKNKLNPEGKLLSSINTDKIEQILGQSEYLENIECVILANNNMLIRATQLVPVLRIFDGANSYYLNKHGKRMNANGSYHADVPIVQGHFPNHKSALSILPITKYVEKDEALRELVTMYSVKDSNNIFIVPCIYGHVINFGDNSNIANKFAKLKKFYREVMPEKGWLTYDTISLKWSHQIVANRRSKKKKHEILYNPEEEEQAPTIESVLVPGLNDNKIASSKKLAQPKEKSGSTKKETKLKTI